MISLSIYEDALNTCYKEYKSNNNIFKWDGNSVNGNLNLKKKCNH